MRIAAYKRVSTGAQAEHGVSLPSQTAEIIAHVEKLGGTIIVEFEEALTAKDDNRPQFRRMIADALSKDHPFDAIVVYDFSRFSRNSTEFEWYREQLKRKDVRLISVREDYGENFEGDLVRKVVGIANELARVRNADGVRRSMRENIRQGFWNGTQPPLGYRVVVTEVRGRDKDKKKLVEDEETSGIVRLTFRLCTVGDGNSGPLGVKKVAIYLNSHGHRTRSGAKFCSSAVGKMLHNEVYAGRFYWGKVDNATKRPRPRDEWMLLEVPALIDEETFQRAQMALRERRRTETPPRITTSNVLLTGIAHCGHCGARMLLSVSHSRNRTYRYYQCSGTFRGTGCVAKNTNRIREELLDSVVLEALADEVLVPDVAVALVDAIVERREAGRTSATESLRQLEQQLSRAKAKVGRLLDGYAEGLIQDTDIFRDRQRAAVSECDAVARLLEHQRKALDSMLVRVTLRDAQRVTERMKERLRSAPIGARKRFLRSLLSVVVVAGEDIEIVGPQSALAEAISGAATTTMARSEPVLHGSDRRWWSRGESNP